MKQRRSKSILNSQKREEEPSASKGAAAETGRIKSKRHSVNAKAKKRVIEVQVPSAGRVVKGRPKHEQANPKAQVNQAEGQPELRVSPSLKGPFRPVRALNLNRPGNDDGEQMSIQEFDRMQEGHVNDLHQRYYTNQEQVSKFLDKTRAKNQAARKPAKCFPAGPVFITKNSDSNISVSQFLDTAFQPEASHPRQGRKLQKIQPYQRNGSPFSTHDEHSPLHRVDQIPLRTFGKRRMTTQPSSSHIDNQLKREMHYKVQQEQNALEGRLQGLCDIPLLDEFCNSRSRGQDSMGKQQKTCPPPASQSINQWQTLSQPDQQPQRKQFRPIQITAAQPSARIPLQVQKMKLTESGEAGRSSKLSRDKPATSGIHSTGTAQANTVNMPVLVNLGPPGTRAETGGSRKRLQSAVSNRGRTGRGRHSTVRPQPRTGSRLTEVQTPATNQAKLCEVGARTNMSVREREATLQQKIQTNFRAQTTMLRTLATPTSVQRQSPSNAAPQADQQLTPNTTFRSAIEASSLRNEECGQTRQRLRSLMQLIERDLDKQARSPKSPASPKTPNHTSRVPRIDAIKQKPLTPKLTSDFGEERGPRMNIVFQQVPQQLPYVGLSKNKIASPTVKESEPQSILPLPQASLNQQAKGYTEPAETAIANLKVQKIAKLRAFPFSLLLVEAFRNRLFDYPSEEPIQDLTEQQVSEVQERQGLGSAILFTLLTYIHRVKGHQGSQQPAHTQNDLPTHGNSAETKTDLKQSESQLRSSSHSVVKLSRRMSLNAPVVHSSSRSLTLMRTSDEVGANKRLRRSASEERFSEQEELGSNNKYQIKQRTQQTQEANMQNREGQMVVGVSYSQKLQQRSLPSAPNGNRVLSSGDALFPIQDQEYTPRGNKLEVKLAKVSSKTKQGNAQQKKDTRLSQKDSITATNLNNARAEQQSSSRRTHFSIEKIPTVGSAHGRNNNLSSSLQMLQPAPGVSIESRNGSVAVNGFAQMNKQPAAAASQDKGYHLRYVSQGMQRSTSIDANQPKYLNSRSSVKGTARKVNVTQNTHNSKDQVIILPTKTITDRVSTQQLQEKKTMQAASSNQRRVGGVSSNNVVSSQQPQLVPVQGTGIADLKMQRSLHVASNQSSIVAESSNSKKAGAPLGTNIAFQTSEYGVMTSKQQPNRANAASEVIQGDYEISGSQKRNQTQKGTAIEAKNVPLIVNSRANIIPSDYLLSNIQENVKTTPIIKGSAGIGPASLTPGETPPAVQSSKQPQVAGSLKQMSKSKHLISLSQQEKPGIQPASQRPQGRGDKLTNVGKHTKQSNQSFQSIMPDGQLGATFNKQNLERALKTAQMGASQRTRPSVLDSSLNVWEAPLSQKLDFSSKHESLATQQMTDVQSNGQLGRDQLVLLHNITPGQGRKPDFRQSTALPKSYKQFVATVNSGLLQTNIAGSRTQGNPSTDQISMYKTTTGGFLNTEQQMESKVLQKDGATRPSGSSKKFKKAKKDDILKMINQLELGENSDTFRHLAKQFYMQNIQVKQPGTSSSKVGSAKQSVILSADGKISTKDGFYEDPMSNFVMQNQSLGSQQTSVQQTKAATTTGRSSNEPQHQVQEESEMRVLQKQLWQQFQLLRILKQTKYQQQLEKCQNRGDGSLPPGGPPGSQSIEYGFDVTEEEMYRILFHQNSPGHKSSRAQKQKREDDTQPYASFDCLECVQMASLMLEEELRFYQQRHLGKRKGKSRDAMHKGNGNSNGKSSGQPHKGIAGLSNQVNLKNQRFSEEDQLAFFRELQEQASGKTKRQRGQTQILAGKRIQNTFDDPRVVGQIFVSRAQPQIFYKKQLNHSFRQVIRGEQMTQYMKAGVTNQQPGQTHLNQQMQPQYAARSHYEAPAIPSMNYGGTNRNLKSKKKEQQATQGRGHGHSGQEGGFSVHGHGHGHGHEHKTALDGTAQGHKRKYKPANSIYQPPLQPFKHLAQSPINQVISKVNELVLILFKQKIKSSDQQIIKLLKFFNITIPRGNGVVLDTKAIKMPDFQHAVNQKLLMKLYKVLNHENNGIKPEQTSQIFRFYVGKGNNYPSVRQIISRRTWWNRGNIKQERFYGQKLQGCYDEDHTAVNNAVSSSLDEQQMMMSSKQFSSGCHFIWTQWRKTEHHDYLKRVQQDRKKIAVMERNRNEIILSSKKSPRPGDDPNSTPKTKPHQSGAYPNVPTLIYNRLEDNYHLSNKKALFLNVSTYYRAMGINPFEVAIPLTFNVKTPHTGDAEYNRFTRAYKQFQQQKDANIWIIKPGENSNRGTGIQVANSLGEIRNIIQQLSSKNGNRTSIVQKYLDKPLLIHNRKFDIRGYAMLTSINGKLKGYMYRDCYFRTSSKQFDLTNLHSRFIHLTNDAIQVNSEDYGRFESGNKLSINDFQRYLDQNHGSKNVCFMRDLFPQMERLVTDSFRAVGSRIDPKRISNCFEIFGYDFMIDENFKVYLIEANTNPCLEICSPLLARIIPELLDNSFRIALDPLYQPAQFLAKLKEDMTSTATEASTRIEPGGGAPRETTIGLNTLRDRAMASEVKGAVNECDNQMSPGGKRGKDQGAAAQPSVQAAQGALKRQRLELLTQIKYTLIYDEKIDKPVVDKILADYEKRLRPATIRSEEDHGRIESPQALEGAAAFTEGPGGTQEGAAQQVVMRSENDDTYALLREIVEEEKLDEQAAIKEEIEAAEDEEAGIMPQPLMLQPLASRAASEEEEDDEIGSEEELFD